MTKVGPYVLKERLGGGGFGVVWRALSPDGTQVACKISRIPQGAPHAWRFLREIRYQDQLNHSGIMPILDYDLDEVHPWFTMPLASQTLFEARPHLDVAVLHEIFAHLCEAVSYAHRNGKLHRDIKPENILRLKIGQERWVISDFGLGRAIDEFSTNRTATFQGAGTRGYAAPEQFENLKGADHRADIYALGQVLNFMHTGGTLPANGAPHPGLGQLSYVVRRCICQEPDERYQSVDELQADFHLLAFRKVDTTSPERRALALLSESDSIATPSSTIDELVQILYTNRSDQRLFLNVMPRILDRVFHLMRKSHPSMTNAIMHSYLGRLAEPVPLDYAEMTSRFLDDIFEDLDDCNLKALVVCVVLNWAVQFNTYTLRTACRRLLNALKDPQEVLSFGRQCERTTDKREWSARYLADLSLAPLVRRALFDE